MEVIKECENSRKLDAQKSLVILREPEENRLNHDMGNFQPKLLRKTTNETPGKISITARKIKLFLSN